ncbi:MAG: hypothetical protein QXQ76_00955 [Candidatus Bathyarchaeia archaeon]
MTHDGGGPSPLIVSFFASLISHILPFFSGLQKVNIVSNEFAKLVLDLAAKIPIAGPIFAAMPPEMAVAICSFLIIWMAFYILFSWFKGILSFLVVFIIGIVLAYFFLSGNISIPIPKPLRP